MSSSQRNTLVIWQKSSKKAGDIVYVSSWEKNIKETAEIKKGEISHGEVQIDRRTDI